MLQLLHEMASSEDGRIRLIRVFGLSPNEIQKIHHMELLVDAGHAEWSENQFPRITGAGYDFIAAVDKNPTVKEKFLDLYNKGMPYFRAAKEAVDLATRMFATA